MRPTGGGRVGYGQFWPYLYVDPQNGKRHAGSAHAVDARRQTLT